MKLAIAGDWHIRATNPESRIDSYKNTQFSKLRYFRDKTTDCDAHLQAGDFFDNPTQPNSILTECIHLFQGMTIHSVYGQHDLKFRNKGNTALDVMIAAEIVKIERQTALAKSVFLYSCSYGEEIPEIETAGVNILLIHKMIVEEKLWEGQADHEWANTLLRRTKFNVIVSGDNHQSFLVEHKGRFLINCGSLMRSSKNQIDHRPCFFVLDTDTQTCKKFYIPILPAEEVFDMQKIEIEKERDEKLIAFVDGLVEGQELGLNFQEAIGRVLKTNKVDKEIVKIITDAMRES